MNATTIIQKHSEEIIEKARKMSSKADFLALLNFVHSLERESKVAPFSKKRLDFLCNSNIPNDGRRYRSFRIPKKSGGHRTISAPVKSLKPMLKSLNIILETLYTPGPQAMGFCIGRSVVDNAKIHIGMNYVLNIDLKDFFHSILQARVWKRLQLPPFSFPMEIASAMAGLACMQLYCGKDEKNQAIFKRVLPQGAPTSPVLTNAICDKLDRRLQGLAKRFNLKYSRYADDITFSSMHYVYSPDGEFFSELKRIISEQNFVINESKTRLQKKGARQEVTGIVVCEKTNVVRRYIRDISFILHVWEKYGRGKAYERFLPDYLSNVIGKVNNNPSMEEVLRGKLLYLKMVKGGEDSVYVKLNDRFEALLAHEKELSSQEENNTEISFEFDYPLSKFEESFKTKISFKEKTNNKFYASAQIAGQTIIIHISKTLNNLPPEQLMNNDKLVISLCRANGKSFWLIRRPNSQEGQQEEYKLFMTVEKLLSIWKEKGIDAAIKANAEASKPSSERKGKVQIKNVPFPVLRPGSISHFSIEDYLKSHRLKEDGDIDSSSEPQEQ